MAPEYIEALGRATYNFAYLEWGIVWLHETIDVGFLARAKSLTAGQIAGSFSKAVDGLAADDADKEALVQLAKGFVDLVIDRNRLVHGNPITVTGGEQCLAYNGKHGRKDWSVRLIEEFSDHAAIISIEAAKILHGGKYDAWKKTARY